MTRALQARARVPSPPGPGVRYDARMPRSIPSALAVLTLGGSAVLSQTAAPPPAPRLAFAFEIRALVGAPLELGDVPRGRRRIVPITGGTFSGSGMRGTIRPGGADWQIVRTDGFTELDTRYTLETDRGELVYVQNAGMRHAPTEVMKRLLAGEPVDPALVYFRTTPVFETSAPGLQWLTRATFVGTGERYPTEVVVRFWRVE
jgi:hypothetical protein